VNRQAVQLCQPSVEIFFDFNTVRGRWDFNTQVAHFFRVKSRATRSVGFEPETSPSRVPSSTTPPITHLCL